MTQRIHVAAGMLAMALIATFWLSTIISELSGSEPLIAAVKTAIPWGFLALIPALAAAAGSGIAMAKANAGLIGAKRKRMPIIAANGLLVLIPSALFLAAKARAGAFDAMFYSVQALELIAGAANLWLLGLNARDGLRLSAMRRTAQARAPKAA
jgi:hypothetical protein